MRKELVRQIALEVVADLAPAETPLFDQVWADAMHDSALLAPDQDAPDRHIGSGSTVQVSLMTLIVIPIVIGVAKDLGVAGVKQIAAYVKKRLESQSQPPEGQLSEEEVERIVDAIAQRFQAHR
jgi:hypothetical protein